MKIGILGSGNVAKALGTGLLKHGYEIMLGTRSAEKLAEWAQQNPKGRVGSFADAAKFGDAVLLAVKGTVAAEALRAAGAANLAGKCIIDATNPIADAAPVNGVLKFFTNLDDSLMEQLQREFAAAHFVKAFNSVGSMCMIDPKFAGGKPTMFICGNNDAAKKLVTGILDQLGWETADMGKAESARAIEPSAFSGAPSASIKTIGPTLSNFCVSASPAGVICAVCMPIFRLGAESYPIRVAEGPPYAFLVSAVTPNPASAGEGSAVALHSGSRVPHPLSFKGAVFDFGFCGCRILCRLRVRSLTLVSAGAASFAV